MAHLVENMFSVGVTPWHGLGVILKKSPETMQEAIELGGLDWQVTKVPSYIDYEGEKIETGDSAIVRNTDKAVLGTVGSRYTPVQNLEAFINFEPLILSGEVSIETAGSLDGGKKVWMLGRLLGAKADVVKDDQVNGYFLLGNSHNGSVSLTCGFTPIRVVCNNTLTMALNNEKSKLLKIRHTKNAATNLAEIMKAINLQKQNFEMTIDQMRLLASKGVDAETLRKYVVAVFRPEIVKRVESLAAETQALEGICKDVIPLFENGKGSSIKGVRGTMWGAYNAITEYLSWESGRNEDTRMSSLWFGKAANTNQLALVEALRLVA